MKTNKYKTQDTECYSFISLWVIGIIIIMATSCSTTSQLSNHYNQQVDCYDFNNK